MQSGQFNGAPTLEKLGLHARAIILATDRTGLFDNVNLPLLPAGAADPNLISC
jgi:hypothetical protein